MKKAILFFALLAAGFVGFPIYKSTGEGYKCDGATILTMWPSYDFNDYNWDGYYADQTLDFVFSSGISKFTNPKKTVELWGTTSLSEDLLISSDHFSKGYLSIPANEVFLHLHEGDKSQPSEVYSGAFKLVVKSDGKELFTCDFYDLADREKRIKKSKLTWEADKTKALRKVAGRAAAFAKEALRYGDDYELKLAQEKLNHLEYVFNRHTAHIPATFYYVRGLVLHKLKISEGAISNVNKYLAVAGEPDKFKAYDILSEYLFSDFHKYKNQITDHKNIMSVYHKVAYEKDVSLWNEAKNIDSEIAYKNYLKNNTLKYHIFKSDAEKALNQVVKADENAWERATRLNSVHAYKNYLNNKAPRYERHREKAKATLENMYQADDKAWGVAKSQHTEASYNAYLQEKSPQYTKHRYSAQRALRSLISDRKSNERHAAMENAWVETKAQKIGREYLKFVKKYPDTPYKRKVRNLYLQHQPYEISFEKGPAVLNRENSLDHAYRFSNGDVILAGSLGRKSKKHNSYFALASSTVREKWRYVTPLKISNVIPIRNSKFIMIGLAEGANLDDTKIEIVVVDKRTGSYLVEKSIESKNTISNPVLKNYQDGRFLAVYLEELPGKKKKSEKEYSIVFEQYSENLNLNWKKEVKLDSIYSFNELQAYINKSDTAFVVFKGRKRSRGFNPKHAEYIMISPTGKLISKSSGNKGKGKIIDPYLESFSINQNTGALIGVRNQLAWGEHRLYINSSRLENPIEIKLNLKSDIYLGIRKFSWLNDGSLLVYGAYGKTLWDDGYKDGGLFVVKLDKSYNKIWEKTYEYPHSKSKDYIEDMDAFYIDRNRVLFKVKGSTNFYLCIDETGNYMWSRWDDDYSSQDKHIKLSNYKTLTVKKFNRDYYLYYDTYSRPVLPNELR